MKAEQQNNKLKNWKLQQIIGEESGDVTEDDMLSSVAFDKDGLHLAVGDNFGRIIVFERDQHKDDGNEYSFVTEMQAHTKAFDALRSEFIYPKIVDIQWLRPLGNSLVFLTATEKAINLCKVGQKYKRTFEPANLDVSDLEDLKMPTPIVETTPTWTHTVTRKYPKLHNNIINSLSVNCNG